MGILWSPKCNVGNLGHRFARKHSGTGVGNPRRRPTILSPGTLRVRAAASPGHRLAEMLKDFDAYFLDGDLATATSISEHTLQYARQSFMARGTKPGVQYRLLKPLLNCIKVALLNGQVLDMLDYAKEALEICDRIKLKKDHPERILAEVGRGFAFLWLGKREEAARIASRLKTLCSEYSPAFAEVVFFIGRITLLEPMSEFAQKSISLAMEKWHERYKEHTPMIAYPMNLYALALLSCSEPDRAERKVKAALRIWQRNNLTRHSGYADSLFVRALIHFRKEEWTAAIKDLKQARQVNDNNNNDCLNAKSPDHYSNVSILLKLMQIYLEREDMSDVSKLDQLKILMEDYEGVIQRVFNKSVFYLKRAYGSLVSLLEEFANELELGEHMDIVEQLALYKELFSKKIRDLAKSEN